MHRDIKPQNFTIGLGKKSHIIHMIDFGLAKNVSDLSYSENNPLVGNSKFASITNHQGIGKI